MAHPDVASEQAYLDHAYDCLDRMREALLHAGDSVVDDVGSYNDWVDVVERYLFDTALAQVTRAVEPASTDGV